jgi:hypothetical protein
MLFSLGAMAAGMTAAGVVKSEGAGEKVGRQRETP